MMKRAAARYCDAASRHTDSASLSVGPDTAVSKTKATVQGSEFRGLELIFWQSLENSRRLRTVHCSSKMPRMAFGMALVVKIVFE